MTNFNYLSNLDIPDNYLKDDTMENENPGRLRLEVSDTPVPKMPAPVPPMAPVNVATPAEAFNLLRTESLAVGRHFLPSSWVGLVARRGLEMLAASDAPTLTPAMRNAGDMVKLLREMLDQGGTGFEWGARVRAILDEIDPPKPATMDELAAMLRVVAEIDAMAPGNLKACAMVELSGDLRAFMPRVPK